MKLHYHPISTTSRPVMRPQVYQVIDGFAASLKGKAMVAV